MSANKLNVTKVTLAPGKIVLLREIKIRDQEMSALAASPKANGDSTMLALLMQKELLKQLIVQINGVAPKASALEDLDGLFSFGEYMQLNQVLGKMAGGAEDVGKFQTEAVSFGGI